MYNVFHEMERQSIYLADKSFVVDCVTQSSTANMFALLFVKILSIQIPPRV